MRDAQERGDLYAETNLSTYCLPIARLGADEPDEAESELRQIMGRWSQRGFHLQHQNALFAHVMIELYRSGGAGIRAWEMIQEQWTELKSSYLLHIFLNRIEIFQFRGRAAVAAARTAAAPKPLLRVAESARARPRTGAIAPRRGTGRDRSCRCRRYTGRLGDR